MKRVLSAFLALVMLVSMFPLNAVPAAASQTDSSIIDSWDGKAATSFDSGTGTVMSPYVIVTAEQLALLANKVNNGALVDSAGQTNVYVMLGNNIDLSGYNWTPIGRDSSHYFTGFFDGKGYTVSGLQISSTSNGIGGLFGYTSGTISNLNLSVDISYVNNGVTVYGGGVAAYNTGSISSVRVSGSVTANIGATTSLYVYCGGIAGYNGKTIEHCSFSGDISAETKGGVLVGGIAGQNEGTINSCYSTGTSFGYKTGTSGSYMLCIAGGIAGGNSSIIKNCFSTMYVQSVVTASSSNAIAGGIVGEARSESAVIEKCFATGEVNGHSTVTGITSTAGGLVGYARGSIKNSFAANTVSATHSKSNTNIGTITTAGRLYGGNSCTVEKSYYNSSYSIFRIVSFTDTKTEGSGCDAKEVDFTNYKGESTASNSGYTGTAAYSPSLITNTLGWSIYQAGNANTPSSYWIAANDRPYLFTERRYCLTVNYHKMGSFGNIVDDIACIWYDAGSSYNLDTPIKEGYSADRSVVSGTINQNTITDVTYIQNIYNLTVEYRTPDGKSLGSSVTSCGYGDTFSIPVPDKTGYTRQSLYINGTMGAEDQTVTAYYDCKIYTLTINYIYSDTGETAAASKQLQVPYGSTYNQVSPTITGYTPSQQVVSGTMSASNQTVTVEYGTNTYQISVVCQLSDGTLISTTNHAITYGQSFSFETPVLEGYTPDKAVVSGTVEDDATYTVTYTPNAYTLTVRYIDSTTGVEVAPAYVQTVSYGEAFSVASPAVTGCTPARETVSGTMPAWNLTETVSYGKNMYPITIIYQYSDGTLIKKDTINLEYSKDYSIASPQINYYTPDKAYVTGIMTDQTTTVTVTYHKNIVEGGAGNCGEQARWTLYEDGMLVISGQGEMYDYEDAAAPWYDLRSQITNVTVEEGITAIGDHAFANCDMVRSISLPKTLQKIGYKSFFRCTTLYEITIGKNVTEIGDGAFANCRNLNIQVEAGNTAFVVEDRVLYTADKEILIAYSYNLYNRDYAVPEGVKTIAPYAFYKNSYIRTLTVPTSVETIGQSAFAECISLRSAQISSTTLCVEADAFKDTSLETLIVDGDITDLGDNAFSSVMIKSAYFRGNAPQNVGSDVFGAGTATLERLCLYYPLDNETWAAVITVSSEENGYKNEYWHGYHAYAFNGVTDVTLTSAGNEKVYAIFVYCDKTPMAEATVTLNGNTKSTDKDGFAYFVHSNLTETDLRIHKDRYISSYEVASSYTLKDIGVDYFTLSTSSSVSGQTCYGNDIVSEIAYINVKYEGMIPILVKGNTEFDIEKMELVQDVKDSKNPSDVFITKILQTVSKGDANLTADGYCRFLVAASAFAYNIDEEYPIYVRMYTSSGEDAIVQQLRIKTISFKFTGDFSNLLGDTSLSLSDTGVPFLDGIQLKIKTPVDCPLSFKVVNNEVYVTWDLDDVLEEELGDIKTEVEGTTSNLKKDIKDTETRVRNYMTKLSYKADEKLNKFKALKFKHTPTFSIDTSMAGGFCIVLGEKNDVQKLQSYLKLSLELKASWTVDFLAVILPLTLEVKASASGEIEVTGFGYDFQNCKVLLPDITLSNEMSLQVSLGLGIRALSAGGFGRLKLSSTIVIGETTYFNGMYLTGEWGFYFKLDIGLWGLYIEKAWEFMNKELIPPIGKKNLDTKQADTTEEEEYEYIPMYELSSYSLKTRSVDVDDMQWSTDLSNDIEYNTYEYAKPQMINYKDQTLLMYLDLCDERSDYNAQALVYRQYDDTLGDWTDPIYVDQNGTSDSSFDLVEYNGELYVIYTETNKVFTDEDTAGKTDQQLMMEISMAQEVVVGKYNAQKNRFEDFRNISNNACYDSNPVISVIDGKLYAAWSSNLSTEESMVFGMNDANNVYITSFDGNAWAESKCIVSDCNPVAQMELINLDGEANVAMIVDEDASYYTADDRNIYIADHDGNVTFIDCYGSTIGTLQTCIYKGKPTLTWDCGGGIKMLSSASATPAVLLDQTSGMTQDYQLVNLSDDILAVTWSEKNILEEGQTIEKSIVYKKLLDDSNQWTETSVAFQTPHYLMNYSLIGYNGDMRFVYTNTNISIDDAGQISMNSKLCSNFQTTGYDLKVGDVTNANVNQESGTVSMDVMLTNNGVKTIKQVSVMIAQRSSATGKITQYYAVGLYDVNLLSDETRTVHFESSIIDNIDLRYADIIINPYEGTLSSFQTYVNTLNQALSWDDSGGASVDSFGGASVGGNIFIQEVTGNMMGSAQQQDLMVEGEYLVIGETEYLSLKVTNLGSTSATGRLNVAKLSQEGDELSNAVYTAHITDLPENGIKYYLVELKKDFFESTEETFKCWLSHCMYSDIETNNTITITAIKMENAPGTQYDDDAVASELSSYNEVFDKYSSGDLELTVTLNGNKYVGLKDEQVNKHAVYVPNADETALDMRVDQEYLKTLDNGFYELVFLFLTDKGHIDCTLNLTVEDNTPIDLTGGISIIGTPDRGQYLQIDTSQLNTKEFSCAWTVDGQVLSTEPEYTIESDILGKELTATVTGTGLYRGSFSSTVYVNKVPRSINTPTITVLEEDVSVQLKKSFIVGDGTVEYGWACVNNPSKVTNWSTDNNFTFTEENKYYMFIRVTGSEIYEDAVSQAVVYNNRRVNMDVTTVTLRPSSAGLYFKARFDIDPDVQVAAKGIAVSLYNTQPVADGSDPRSLCAEGSSSVLISNILSDKKTAAQNAQRAAMPIYARAYVLLEDGTYLYSDTVSVDLQQVTEIVDTMWADLSETQQTSIKAMYDKFKEAMTSWQLVNIAK